MHKRYLQWPQGDIYVSVDAICTEHGLMRSSGEGQHGFLVLFFFFLKRKLKMKLLTSKNYKFIIHLP